MSQQLEEEFKERERKRLLTEKLKHAVVSGEPLPGSLKDTLRKVVETKALLSDLIEAKELERLMKSLQLASSMKMVEQNLTDVIQQFTEVKNMLATVSHGLSAVSQQLSADTENRAKLMVKQLETLEKIDNYLEKWS